MLFCLRCAFLFALCFFILRCAFLRAFSFFVLRCVLFCLRFLYFFDDVFFFVCIFFFCLCWPFWATVLVPRTVHTKRFEEQVTGTCPKNSNWFELVGLVAGTNSESKLVSSHDGTCLRDLLQELVQMWEKSRNQ